MEKIRIGISSCLLGEQVRYDGGHRWDRYITETLGQYLEFVPVCPEVELGLGVPREAMRLVGDPAAPRLVTVRTGVEHTEAMARWASRRVQELEPENLCGFIFKSGSPSSGMGGVKVCGPQGIPVKRGVGIFARVFMEHFSLLPVIDEARLHDPDRRENFIERVFVFARWRELLQHPSLGGLVSFHTRHKLLILAHSLRHHRLLGNLVARARELSLKEAHGQYQTMLQEALLFKATPRKHINVLHHLLGYFTKDLTADEKQELLELIEQYRRGAVPLLVPLTLINHYVRKYGQGYLKEQFYLNPHPLELQLRHHA